MNLLAAERIKFLSTRSPWLCLAAAFAVYAGFSVVMSLAGQGPITVTDTQTGGRMAMALIVVLAALAVTTEYRFGTIRTTFQAVPHRGSALVAKTTVVALLALVIGEIAGFGSWGIANLLAPTADLALNSSADWINVAGVGPVYALAAVIAVAVGILIRHSAGAIALLLIYNLAVEGLVPLIPNVGEDIHRWMPFNVANKFVTGDGASAGAVQVGPPLSDSTLSPAWALAYFAGFALVMLGVAIFTAKRRDA